MPCVKHIALSLSVLAAVAMPLSAGRAGAAPHATLVPELVSWCDRLSSELKSVHHERCIARAVELPDADDEWAPDPVSLLGKRPVDTVDAPGEPGPRRVLVLGAIHGDEISAVSAVFRWIDFLDRTKPDSFLRQNVYMFFPLVNPDGFYAKPRTRTNSGGVDLNRNFATKLWNEEATLFWKKKASGDLRRFPGKSPASGARPRWSRKRSTSSSPT